MILSQAFHLLKIPLIPLLIYLFKTQTNSKTTARIAKYKYVLHLLLFSCKLNKDICTLQYFKCR